MINWDYLAIVVCTIYAAAIGAFICFAFAMARENKRLRGLLRDLGHPVDDTIHCQPNGAPAKNGEHNRDDGDHSQECEHLVTPRALGHNFSRDGAEMSRRGE